MSFKNRLTESLTCDENNDFDACNDALSDANTQIIKNNDWSYEKKKELGNTCLNMALEWQKNKADNFKSNSKKLSKLAECKKSWVAIRRLK